jgi:II/X family phage/plasmid replication protein
VPYLDFDSWSLRQIDITFSSRAKDDREARAFINALQNVSYGQAKCRTGYDGTSYFGKKNSRLKKIKVYLKPAEVRETIRKNLSQPDGELLNEVYTPQLLGFTAGLIRWEVSLYHRYFERLGLSCRLDDIFLNRTFAPNHLCTFWQIATLDLFTALKGQTMKIIDNSEIQDALRAQFSKTGKRGKVSTVLADSAFRTYRDIRRDGYVITRDSMSRTTFHYHVKMLTECGLSRAALQNMHGLNDGADIIPFVRFIGVDFAAQHPDWYTHPEPQHVYKPVDTTPYLRLVA